MFGSRFLRSVAVALWLYGLLGAVIGVGLLIVGLSSFEQVLSLQKTLESERTSVVQSVRGMSGTLRDTAAATSDFQHSIDTARSSADQASRLSNDSAGTFRSLGSTFTSLTFLGLQPLAALAPQFDRSADQLQQLAISLGTTREAGFDARSLLPFQIAFFAICLLILVQSAFSILAGVVIYRLQRSLGREPLLALGPKTATTNGVGDAGRVRAS